MSANQNQLQGKVSEKPEEKTKDVEGLLRGFIRALTEEVE